MKEPLYTSKFWSVKEWDCRQRSQNEFAWDNEEGKLCTDNENTANLFRVLDLVREWRINAGFGPEKNWVVNFTEAGYKSGYRDEYVNRISGGVPNSNHTKGCAADICIAGQDDSDTALAQTIWAAAQSFGSLGLPGKLNIGYYGDWIHIEFVEYRTGDWWG